MSEVIIKYLNNRPLITRVSQSLLQAPARMVIFGFALLIATGAVALMLPAASHGQAVEFIDALFTSTSAVCVTGLTVVDTGSAFSGFGHLIILVLIQTGGLGIMTFSTFILLMVGRRPGLAGRTVVQDAYTHSRERGLPEIIKDVVLFTCGIEIVGATVMFFYFLPKLGAIKALKNAVFHSVSAFCNAGFSLFSDSFVGYRQSWVLNLAVCFLIVSGGIGFLVLSELKQKMSFKSREEIRLSLHSKIVLFTTLLLIVAGMLMILMTEWKNTLAPMGGQFRILSAFFQSVTARTAGFNTLPIGSMTNETLFVLILLMFIGASPGSCGGGIKTTSLAALAAMGLSRFREHPRPQFFHRTLSEASVQKAVGVVMLSTLVVCAGIITLQLTEIGGISHLQSRGKFLEIFFEVVSAFGTVGLSTGITAGLSAFGKMVIICIMFIGRLGPLVIGAAISCRSVAGYYYAEENIIVG